MGHMDRDPDHDYTEKTYTVKVYWPHNSAPDVFRSCTEIETDEGDLNFTDPGGKHHQFYGAKYEIAEE